MIQKQSCNRHSLISLAVAVVFFLFFNSVVLATEIPPIPTAFFGVASIDGEYLPTGTTIIAKIDGVEKGSIQTQKNGLFGGKGGFEPKLLVKGTDSNDVGRYINFFVGEQKFKQTIKYDSETHEIVLSIGAIPNPPVGFPEEKTNQENLKTKSDINPCVENWVCEDWSTCNKQTKIQTRTCIDKNNCRTTISKPSAEKDCVYIPTIEEQKKDMVEYNNKLKAEKEQELQESQQSPSDSNSTEKIQSIQKDKSNNEIQLIPFDLVASVLIIFLISIASYFIFMKFKRGK